jgi:hypothetical protein
VLSGTLGLTIRRSTLARRRGDRDGTPSIRSPRSFRSPLTRCFARPRPSSAPGKRANQPTCRCRSCATRFAGAVYPVNPKYRRSTASVATPT